MCTHIFNKGSGACTNFDLYAAKCPHLWNELLLIMLSMTFSSLETHETGMSTLNKNISVALSDKMNCRVSVYDQNVLISVFSWFVQHLWNMPEGYTYSEVLNKHTVSTINFGLSFHPVWSLFRTVLQLILLIQTWLFLQTLVYYLSWNVLTGNNWSFLKTIQF